MADTPWLRTREAAAYLRLHRNTLLRQPREVLPYTTINARGDRRYNRADLDAFLTDNRELTSPDGRVPSS